MAIDLASLLAAPGVVDRLLENLDSVARSEGAFEYGLPLHTDANKAQLREAVYRWVSENDQTAPS